MAKTRKNKPLRFIVTGALLIGPGLQACEDPVEANEPMVLENEVPPPAPIEPTTNEIEPSSDQETPVQEPQSEGESAEQSPVDDGAGGTNVAAPRPPTPNLPTPSE